MRDTHTHTPLLPSHTYIYSPYRQYSEQETRQQRQWPPVAPSCSLLPTTDEWEELNGNLLVLAEYIPALSAHTAQCSYTFTVPTYAHSAQVLANSVLARKQLSTRYSILARKQLSTRYSILARKQLSTRSMWTTTNVVIHFQSYIWNVLHASRLYGCVEYAMYLHQVEIPAWQGGTYIATDLWIWFSDKIYTTKY